MCFLCAICLQITVVNVRIYAMHFSVSNVTNELRTEVQRRLAESANVTIDHVIPSSHQYPGRTYGDTAIFVYDVLFDFLAPVEDHRSFRTLVTQDPGAIFTSFEAFDGYDIQVLCLCV